MKLKHKAFLHFLFVSSLVIVLFTSILFICKKEFAYIPVFSLLLSISILGCYFNNDKGWVGSYFYFYFSRKIKQKEKTAILQKLYDEEQLILTNNINVVIEELPTFKEIEIINSRLKRYKNYQHNEYIQNIFNDLDNDIKSLLEINDFLIDVNEVNYDYYLDNLKNRFKKEIDILKQKKILNNR